MSHDHSRSGLPDSGKYEPNSPHDRDLIRNDRRSRSDHPISAMGDTLRATTRGACGCPGMPSVGLLGKKCSKFIKHIICL